VDAEDGDATVLVGLVQALHAGDGHAAGIAPAGPEIQDDDAPAVLGEGDQLAARGVELEIRGPGPGAAAGADGEAGHAGGDDKEDTDELLVHGPSWVEDRADGRARARLGVVRA